MSLSKLLPFGYPAYPSNQPTNATPENASTPQTPSVELMPKPTHRCTALD
jgi:hypothetical protein